MSQRRRWLAPLGTRQAVWFSLIAWSIVQLSVLRISEADIWYHLRNAQHLVATHTMLRTDLYTFTSAGVPLVNYEWLSELPYYFAYQSLGMRGLLAVYVALLIAIFGGVYYLACIRGGNYREGALLTMAGVALGSYSFGPRMMHFGWLCLVVLLIVLERSERSPRLVWVMPPLFALWINLHGSWIFGFVVLGAVILAGTIEGEWGIVTAKRRSPIETRRLLAATAASVAALFANPYGLKLVWYPFDLLLRQQANLATVIEWQSVDFHSGYGKLAMAMILGLLGVALLTREPWGLQDALLGTFALWASLTHVRFLLFAAIILTPIVARRLHLFARSDERGDAPLLNAVLVTAMLAIMIRTVPPEPKLEARITEDFPRAAVEFMKTREMSGRLFNAYDFGGFIEWNAPAMKTFADGRTDIFVYNGVFADYLDIVLVRNSLELLTKHDIRYVLYTPGTPFTYLLDHSRSWRRVYSDAVANVYERGTDSLGRNDLRE